MNQSEQLEDEKFAADFVDVFGGFPKDQAISLLVRRQHEIRKPKPTCESEHYEFGQTWFCRLPAGHELPHDSHPDSPLEGMSWKTGEVSR